MGLVVGIDIGGTFTDLFAVASETGEMYSAKSLTTPDDLSRGVFECLEKAVLAPADIDTLIHGSTLAINIALERRGARTGLVVTRGTRDVYEIGRGNRPDSYNPFFQRPQPLVPRHLIFEAEERYAASGDVLTELSPAHALDVASVVRAAGVDSVAVCFLHSYVNPQHEEIMGDALRQTMPHAYVSLSHEIVREYREYERTSTTVLNAYVGPRAKEYLEQLEVALAARAFTGRFLIMQSNGGVMAPANAKRVPVAMMESGPVGGVISSAQLGRESGYPHLITFDMGGTTAKSSLVRDASPTIAHGYHVGGYASGHPAMLPVVDIVEVGAGGGSIAWLDGVGAMRLGPHSAGADPGPICYGRGGTEPTVTDANVVLGRIDAENFQGGDMKLDIDAARQGIDARLGLLGRGIEELAMGIVRLAVANMVLAVRSVSVERGYDPRDFVLLAQGGNGPLHAVEVARELGVPEVIVPPLPGIFSAVGMLMADLRHDYVRTYYATLTDARFDEIVRIFDELVNLGHTTLLDEGVVPEAMEFERALDLRYAGQEFALTVLFTAQQLDDADPDAIRQAFHEAHGHRFGHKAITEEVEMINLRLAAVGIRPKPPLRQPVATAPDTQRRTRPVGLDSSNPPADCDVYRRSDLGQDAEVRGPALIEEHDSTTLLWPGDIARVGSAGELTVKVAS